MSRRPIATPPWIMRRVKELSDTHYPKASKIILVRDNLNTNEPALLYVGFEEIAAWEHCRNKKHAKADGQFNTADARI